MTVRIRLDDSDLAQLLNRLTIRRERGENDQDDVDPTEAVYVVIDPAVSYRRIDELLVSAWIAHGGPAPEPRPASIPEEARP